MSKKARKFFAARYWVGNEVNGSWTGPSLFSTKEYNPDGSLPDEIKANYGWGPSYTILSSKNFQVVRDYGLESDLTFDSLKGVLGKAVKEFEEIEDALEAAFIMEFYKPEPSIKPNLGGWLSPDGKYYSCEYGEHDGEAKCIAVCQYYSFRGDRLLEEKGWIKVMHDGTVLAFDKDHSRRLLNQRQVDILGDVLSVATDEGFRRRLMRAIAVNEPV